LLKNKTAPARAALNKENNNMASITSTRQSLEGMAEGMTWASILEPVGYIGSEIETLKNGEILIEWVYESNGLYSSLQTWSEVEVGIITDFAHHGQRQISKFDAILRLRAGGSFSVAKSLLTEAITLGENSLDHIGRKHWSEYLQSSTEMAPEVLYYSNEVFQSQVDGDYINLLAKDFAKSKFEESKFALEGEPVKAVSLRDLLTTAIPRSKWLVDGLLMKAGKIFFAAQAKAGKTTVTLALLKSLVDGNLFLGKFKVEVPSGRIGYMNLELTEGQMQEWVARQGIENVDKVHFWNLRGKPNPFRSDASRLHLIKEIKDLGIKTLIIDTFAKIFPGEANNNSEVNRYLIMLDDVLDRAGVEQLVMLVHAGNDASKIRGATALTDHPDGIWYLINDSQKNRYFSAIGRDIEIAEGQIIYDKSTSELSFTGAGKRATKDLTSRERVIEFVKVNPGSNASEIDESIGGTKAFKIKIRKQLVKDGLVTVRKGPNNSSQYYVA